ncbi:MAG: FAD-dependent oxidoreductase [Desulfovibrionaceae bacterium]
MPADAMNFAFMRPDPAPANGRRIAIIGAGPSGLAATGYLACLGYQVDVYDKLPKPGGLMLFGIPAERIPAERIHRGTSVLSRTFGVMFHCNTKICCSNPLHEEEGDHFSSDLRSLDELVEIHDAVIICTGSWKSRKMGIAGEDRKQVFSSLEFLFPIRAARYAANNVRSPEVRGKRLAVIGAGHSAVDVAQSSLSLGAAEVHMLYRRTMREAPAGEYELSRLLDKGCQWHERCTPTAIMGAADLVSALAYTDGAGQNHELPVDMVVTAIGEIPTPPFQHQLGLEDVRKGEVRWLNMTRIENVFVAGDVLSGPSKIGKAVYSGLRAARSLTHWLDLKVQHREDEYNYDADVITPNALR